MLELASPFLLVVIASFLGACGAFFLKRGADRSHFRLQHPQVNPRIFLGLGLYFLGSVIYIVALRHGELSMLYPVASLTYLWAMFLAAWQLNEPINTRKVLGLILLLVGVGVIHATNF